MKSTTKSGLLVPGHVHLLNPTGPVQVFYEAGCYGADNKLSYFGIEDKFVRSAGLPLTAVAKNMGKSGERRGIIYFFRAQRWVICAVRNSGLSGHFELAFGNV